eukprot:scaffold49019_cov63-Phaeocystis_antarctica.AAC.8
MGCCTSRTRGLSSACTCLRTTALLQDTETGERPVVCNGTAAADAADTTTDGGAGPTGGVGPAGGVEQACCMACCIACMACCLSAAAAATCRCAYRACSRTQCACCAWSPYAITAAAACCAAAAAAPYCA